MSTRCHNLDAAGAWQKRSERKRKRASEAIEDWGIRDGGEISARNNAATRITASNGRR
jgi:hypothetical protein